MASIAAPPTRSTEVHNHHHSSGVHSSSHSSSKYSLGGGVAAEEYTGGALDKGRRRTAQVASLDSDGLYTQVGQYVEIATHHVYHTPVKIEAARKLQNLFRSWRDWSTFQYLKQVTAKQQRLPPAALPHTPPRLTNSGHTHTHLSISSATGDCQGRGLPEHSTHSKG